jgi:hypothetical protein
LKIKVLSFTQATNPYYWYSVQGRDLVANTTISIKKWHHFGFTLDSKTNILSTYLDGLFIYQGTTVPVTSGLHTGNSFGPTYSAYLDDFKIFNRSLSQQEIVKVLNSYY